MNRLRRLARRRFFHSFAAAVLLLGVAAVPAAAQTEDTTERIVVADVRGPLEQRAIDFLVEAVETPGAVVVVIQLNNPGIGSGDPTVLYDAIERSPIPVAGWVGPSGAEAYGGAAELLLLADQTGVLADPSTAADVRDELLVELTGHARPITDVRSSAGYRQAMLDVLSRRALKEANERLAVA